jgi:predicted O-methyltransferase YrrM
MPEGLKSWLRRLVIWKLVPRRVQLPGPHFELSVISPLNEAAGRASDDLISLGLDAARGAMDVNLAHLRERSADARQYLSEYPGEHYHLLASLVRILKPKQVTEIGTFTGLSALSIMTALGNDAHLTTFDIVPWDRIPDTALRPEDFASGQLEQRIGDLADEGYFRQNKDVLDAAGLIFVDGPKDGRFEPAFLELLVRTARKTRSLLVLDDIRLWNMLRVWAELPLTKLDMTSFGHWSGTGICWLEAQ